MNKRELLLALSLTTVQPEYPVCFKFNFCCFTFDCLKESRRGRDPCTLTKW